MVSNSGNVVVLVQKSFHRESILCISTRIKCYGADILRHVVERPLLEGPANKLC